MRTAVEKKKLHLIEEFLKIQNEDILNIIESIIKEERLKALEIVLNKPFTEKEFNEMIDQAEKDASQGKVFSSKELKKLIQTWK